MVLSGSNTYTGGTTVYSGTLIVASNVAIQDGTDLSVGADLSAFGAVIPSQAGGATPAMAAAPVPEPGTLVLLAAGLLLFFYRTPR